MFNEIIEKCNETYLISPFGYVNYSISFYSNIVIDFKYANNGSLFFKRLIDVHLNYIELEPKCLYYLSSFGILVSFILLIVHFIDDGQRHDKHHRSNISSKNLSSYVVSYCLLYIFKILYYKVAFLNVYFFLYSLMVYITAFLTLITTFDTYLVIRHSILEFRIVNFNFDNYIFLMYSLCGWGIPIISSYCLLYFEQLTIDGFVNFICFAEVILRMLSTIFLFLTLLTLKKSTLSKFSKKFYARLVVLSGSVFLMSWIESICNALNYFIVIDVYVLCAVRYSSDIAGAYEGVIIFCLFTTKSNHKRMCRVFHHKMYIAGDVSSGRMNPDSSTSPRHSSDYNPTIAMFGSGHDTGISRRGVFRTLRRSLTSRISFYVANK